MIKRHNPLPEEMGFQSLSPFVYGNNINSSVRNEAQKLPASAEPGQVKPFPAPAAFPT